MEIKTGIKNTSEIIVKEKDTAANYGSGLLKVFATPAMVALMENTALNCVKNFLPKGYDTVGTEINIKHLNPTPVGKKVKCTAVLTKSDNKKLTFEVNAWDESNLIGTGIHKRYIINTESFMERMK